MIGPPPISQKPLGSNVSLITGGTGGSGGPTGPHPNLTITLSPGKIGRLGSNPCDIDPSGYSKVKHSSSQLLSIKETFLKCTPLLSSGTSMKLISFTSLN